MTIVVRDDRDGVEVNLGESDIHPGVTNCTIFGPSREAVQGVIFSLAEEYDNVEFENPAPIGNKTRWGTMGRVW